MNINQSKASLKSKAADLALNLEQANQLLTQDISHEESHIDFLQRTLRSIKSVVLNLKTFRRSNLAQRTQSTNKGRAYTVAAGLSRFDGLSVVDSEMTAPRKDNYSSNPRETNASFRTEINFISRPRKGGGKDPTKAKKDDWGSQQITHYHILGRKMTDVEQKSTQMQKINSMKVSVPILLSDRGDLVSRVPRSQQADLGYRRSRSPYERSNSRKKGPMSRFSPKKQKREKYRGTGGRKSPAHNKTSIEKDKLIVGFRFGDGTTVVSRGGSLPQRASDPCSPSGGSQSPKIEIFEKKSRKGQKKAETSFKERNKEKKIPRMSAIESRPKLELTPQRAKHSLKRDQRGLENSPKNTTTPTKTGTNLNTSTNNNPGNSGRMRVVFSSLDSFRKKKQPEPEDSRPKTNMDVIKMSSAQQLTPLTKKTQPKVVKNLNSILTKNMSYKRQATPNENNTSFKQRVFSRSKPNTNSLERLMNKVKMDEKKKKGKKGMATGTRELLSGPNTYTAVSWTKDMTRKMSSGDKIVSGFRRTQRPKPVNQKAHGESRGAVGHRSIDNKWTKSKNNKNPRKNVHQLRPQIKGQKTPKMDARETFVPHELVESAGKLIKIQDLESSEKKIQNKKVVKKVKSGAVCYKSEVRRTKGLGSSDSEQLVSTKKKSTAQPQKRAKIG